MIHRRDMLAMAAIAAAGAADAVLARPAQARDGRFPEGFLWGAATAAHQSEGNNVNSDIWAIEHTRPTIYSEPSGDACDSYHRYGEDIALVKSLGLNTYRFSIEWARIEPEQGQFSAAEIDHYRRMIAACREAGLKPVVTFNHFTAPRWFAMQGGWENPRSPELFARYAERAAKDLADLMHAAVTLNEPSLLRLLHWLPLPPQLWQAQTAMLQAVSRRFNVENFSVLTASDHPDAMIEPLLAAHRRGADAIKAARPDLPVGVSLPVIDVQAVGRNSRRDAMRADVYGRWLDAARTDDFVGVQTYGRMRLDRNGFVAPPANAEMTQMGEEFYPEGLEGAIRYVHGVTGRPVMVTENGIATTDDARRVEYIRRAVRGVKKCLDDSIPVLGYIHWSLLDNFEWFFGYRPKFGLVACDRQTFARTPKPSAHVLGAIAAANAI